MIHSYDKEIADRLGWVADRCPLCRAIGAHELKRIRQVQHLAPGLTTGQQVVRNHQVRCVVCGLMTAVDPQRYAAAVTEQPDGDLERLIRETQPELPTRDAEVLARDAVIRQRPAALSSLERRLVMLEIFFVASPTADARSSPAQSADWPVGLGWCLFLLFPVVILAIAAVVDAAFAKDFDLLMPLALRIAGVMSATGFLAVVVTTWTYRGRALRRDVIPLLCLGLAPLQPTLTDLETVLTAARLRGVKYVRYLDPSKLAQALETGRRARPK